MSGRNPFLWWSVRVALRWMPPSLLLAVLPGAPPAHAGAITFSTALPVSSGRAVLRVQSVWHSAGADRRQDGRSLKALVFRNVLAYGVTGKLTLFGVLPRSDARLEFDLPDGSGAERRAAAIGDARLVVRYTLLQRDEPARTFRIAPFAGIELPTGSDDRSDAFGRLPPALQPGSGSWDLIGGVALTRQTLGWEVDAAAAIQVAGHGDWFDPGNAERLDVSWQRRILPRRLGGGVPGFLYAVLESNLIRKSRTVVRGVEDPASGGTSWLVGPGLQYVTRSFVFEGVVQVPVVQDFGVGALETDFVVTLGVRIYL